jgi:hypothetical protein
MNTRHIMGSREAELIWDAPEDEDEEPVSPVWLKGSPPDPADEVAAASLVLVEVELLVFVVDVANVVAVVDPL